jgi:AAA domain, putative AbiEii toxin, Type IV TA system
LRTAADAARKRAHALPAPEPNVLTRATELGLDAAAATKARDAWTAALSAGDGAKLATAIEAAAGPLETAAIALRAQAAEELKRREDRWNPLAFDVIAWLPKAKEAAKAAAAVKPLDKAEKWLKQAASDIRNARFTPIKERAQQVWSLLRIQSNVSLDDIRLTGAATRRTAELDLRVDGVEGALGVMSQGEQNALALSLFIPRACLSDSPFRFAVIDDPVQSMDPSRVDGLARVLRETALTRQLVVFTHDDRLSEAVRRLAIDATVVEVTRREGSAVAVRKCKDPVARHITDAMDVAQTDGLPVAVGRRVVPGLCRLAIEAACAEAVRRRRLGRGDPHADVEEALGSVRTTNVWTALALFDGTDASEVMGTLNKQNPAFADILRAVKEGAHEGWTGDLIAGVRSAEKLAAWLRTRT